MTQKKTLAERERELQTLLAIATGREELNQLADLYHEAGGRVRPEGTSIVTYILVHEREHGLIGF